MKIGYRVQVAALLAVLACLGFGPAAGAAAQRVNGFTSLCGAMDSAHPATVQHVMFIVFENRSYGAIVGSSSAPYINQTLIRGCGLATNYHNYSHPSTPNRYLAPALTMPFTEVGLASRPGLAGMGRLAASRSSPGPKAAASAGVILLAIPLVRQTLMRAISSAIALCPGILAAGTAAWADDAWVADSRAGRGILGMTDTRHCG